MTANDIIRRSLRLITVLGMGQPVTYEQLSYGLEALNGMVSQWATQRLTIVVTAREVFDLVSSQQTYTIGDGGDFDTQRPVFLPRASTISQTGSSQPLELPLQILSTQQWQEWVGVKNVDSALPIWLYYDFAYPLGNISLWPIPNVGDLDIALYLPKAIDEFASGATDQDFAPGYTDALTYNLAVRLAPEYGRPISQEVAMMAAETLGNIKRANIRIAELRCETGLNDRRDGLYNWISDGPVW